MAAELQPVQAGGGLSRRYLRALDWDAKYIGWHCLSLGIHVDLRGPFVELHLPGGYVRFGFMVFDTRTRSGTSSLRLDPKIDQLYRIPNRG